MSQAIKLFVYPVKDVNSAKEVFEQFLGTKPYADAPYYVGFRVGTQEIGLDPNAHKQGITSPIGYVEVPDIKASLKSLISAGATLKQDAKDVGGGRLVATVTDKDDNILGLFQNP